MRVKKVVFAVLFAMLGTGVWMNTGFTQQTGSGEKLYSNPDRCALMIRKGKESFARSRYIEAKEFFRRAVQADPSSVEAWSYYDLAAIYTVAEQFKNHGRIVTSTAPPPEETRVLDSETPVTLPEPSPEKSTEKIPPVQIPPGKPPVPPLKIMDDDGC
jgi:hypothetical protein